MPRVFTSPSRSLTIRLGPGMVARFESGAFATEDERLIQGLRKHVWYGHLFYEAVMQGDKVKEKQSNGTGRTRRASRKALAQANN